MFVHTAPFLFLPCLFRKESKFGRSAALLAVLLANFSVELVGFYLVLLVGICPGCGTWRGSGVRMV